MRVPTPLLSISPHLCPCFSTNADAQAAWGEPHAGQMRSKLFLCMDHRTLRITRHIGGSSVLHHNMGQDIHHSGEFRDTVGLGTPSHHRMDGLFSCFTLGAHFLFWLSSLCPSLWAALHGPLGGGLAPPFITLGRPTSWLSAWSDPNFVHSRATAVPPCGLSVGSRAALHTLPHSDFGAGQAPDPCNCGPPPGTHVGAQGVALPGGRRPPGWVTLGVTRFEGGVETPPSYIYKTEIHG